MKKLNADPVFAARLTKMTPEKINQVSLLRQQGLSWRKIAAAVGGITPETARNAFIKTGNELSRNSGTVESAPSGPQKITPVSGMAGVVRNG